jgi:hypothetical protein
MDQFLNSLLLVGAFVFVIGMVHAVRILLRHRRYEAAPFRNYFPTEYDRDLLRYSALSESEDWMADLLPPAASSGSRDSGDREQ